MADFGGGFEDNWGLHAIVRGSTSASSGFSTSPADSCFLEDDININGGFFFGIPDDHEHNPFHSNYVAMLNDDDLQEFYKPFYNPVSDSSSSCPPPPPPAAAAAAAAIRDDSIYNPFVKSENKDEKPQQTANFVYQPSPPDAACCSSDTTTAATINNAQTPKYRKRKNQNKRVVQVQAAAGGAEGLPSDMWAWRKYGQKPIKGSPFPRSYYRCSSSKVCLARKQVEQSCTEPGVFLISYAAEHNHAQPIRKNALAGTTRQKFPAATQLTPPPWTTSNSNSNNNNATTLISEYKENSTSHSNWSPSPISTAGDHVVHTSAFEDGCCSIKQELQEKNMKMEDEFFAGLEDLDGLISELASGQQQYSSKMFSMNFYS